MLARSAVSNIADDPVIQRPALRVPVTSGIAVQMHDMVTLAVASNMENYTSMTSSTAKSKPSEPEDTPNPSTEKHDEKKVSGKHHKRKGKSSRKAKRGAEKESDLKDQLLRLRADFENFRKRTVREKDETYRRASENIILDLLPVLDNLSLGLKAAQDHGADETFIQGYQMVADQLMTTLQGFGLKPIEAVGTALDPAFHDAIANVPSDDHDEGIVVSETQKGYCLGERLLRAARVVVSCGPQALEAAESTEDD